MNFEKAPLASAVGASQATVPIPDGIGDGHGTFDQADSELPASLVLADDTDSADNEMNGGDKQTEGQSCSPNGDHSSARPLERQSQQRREPQVAREQRAADQASTRAPINGSDNNSGHQLIPSSPSVRQKISLNGNESESGGSQEADAAANTTPARAHRRSSRRRSEITRFGVGKSSSSKIRKSSEQQSKQQATLVRRGANGAKRCDSLSDLVMAGQLRPGDLLFLVSTAPLNADGSGILVDEGTLMADRFIEVSWHKDKLVSCSEWARSLRKKRGGARYESMEEASMWKRVRAFRRSRAVPEESELNKAEGQGKFLQVVEDDIPPVLQLPTLAELRDSLCVNEQHTAAPEALNSAENQENGADRSPGRASCPAGSKNDDGVPSSSTQQQEQSAAAMVASVVDRTPANTLASVSPPNQADGSATNELCGSVVVAHNADPATSPSAAKTQVVELICDDGGAESLTRSSGHQSQRTVEGSGAAPPQFAKNDSAPRSPGSAGGNSLQTGGGRQVSGEDRLMNPADSDGGGEVSEVEEIAVESGGSEEGTVVGQQQVSPSNTVSGGQGKGPASEEEPIDHVREEEPMDDASDDGDGDAPPAGSREGAAAEQRTDASQPSSDTLVAGGWQSKVPTKRRQQQPRIDQFVNSARGPMPAAPRVAVQPQLMFVPSVRPASVLTNAPRQTKKRAAPSQNGRVNGGKLQNTFFSLRRSVNNDVDVDRKPSRQEIESILDDGPSQSGCRASDKDRVSLRSGQDAGSGHVTMSAKFRSLAKPSAVDGSGPGNDLANDRSGGGGGGLFGTEPVHNPFYIASGGKTVSGSPQVAAAHTARESAVDSPAGPRSASLEVTDGPRGWGADRHERVPETQCVAALFNSVEGDGQERTASNRFSVQQQVDASVRSGDSPNEEDQGPVVGDMPAGDDRSQMLVEDDGSADDVIDAAASGERNFFPSQPPPPFAPSPVGSGRPETAAVLVTTESSPDVEVSQVVRSCAAQHQPVVMGSGLLSDDLSEIQYLCRKLIGHGRLIHGKEQWNRSVTHLVVVADEPLESDNSEGREDHGPRAPRSIKYLCALLSCKKIVSRTWVKASLAAKEWADETPHLCQGDRHLPQSMVAEVQKRVRLLYDEATGQSKLFAGLRVFVVDPTGGDAKSDVKIVHVEPAPSRRIHGGGDEKVGGVPEVKFMPPADHLKLLARVGGAQILADSEPPAIPISVQEIRAAGRCPLIILADGNNLTEAEAHELYLRTGVRPLSYAWLLASAAQAELLPKKDYYLIQLTRIIDSSDDDHSDSKTRSEEESLLQTQHSLEF